jgi:hypothetical protein
MPSLPSALSHHPSPARPLPPPVKQAYGFALLADFTHWWRRYEQEVFDARVLALLDDPAHILRKLLRGDVVAPAQGNNKYCNLVM